MSFKSSLNALFKLSGTQAMPKWESFITYDAKGTYTAPYDGYIHLHGATDNSADEIQLDINGDRKANLISVTAGNWLDFVLPVRKGDRCKVVISGKGSTLRVKFYRTMGGGS